MYFITFAIKYGLQKLKQAKVLSDSICVLSEVDLHSYCRIRQTFGEKNRNENRALETAVKKIGTKFVSRQFVTNWCNLMWFPLVLIWEVETLQQNESTFVPSLFILKATCFWWFIRRTHATFSAKFPRGGWGFTNDVIQCWTKVEAVLKSEISKRCLGLLN